MIQRFFWFGVLVFCFPAGAFAQSLFSVDKIIVWEKAPSTRNGIYDEPGSKFVPSVEAQLRTKVDTDTAGLIVKAYFFDVSQQLVGSQPRPAEFFIINGNRPLPMPGILQKGKVTPVFFRIPDALRGRKWTVLVVVGNAREGTARALPAVDPHGLIFPERNLVYGGMSPGAPSAPAGPLVVEYVARTASKLQPQITMFFRMPPGTSDPRELKGLICVIAVADTVEDVKNQLLTLDSNPDRVDTMKLITEKKLGILSWGARTLWSKEAGYEELTPEEKAAEGREFDLVANGWAAAVDEMSRRYGIPNGNMLISGDCQASQWAERLVMRKPERFRAALLRLGSSLESPRPQGARVIWALSTGELDGGYMSNLEFYDACREMGYPITMKAEPRVGHVATRLGGKLEEAFFKLALEVPESPPRGVATPVAGKSPAPWPASFRQPAYWGDVLTQAVVPAAEVESIDPANRVPLPTEDMVKAWTWREPEEVPPP